MEEDYSEYGAIPHKKDEDYSEYGAIPHEKNTEGTFFHPPIERAREDIEQQRPFNEFLAGGAQGLMNLPSGLANLPIKAANYFGGKNIKEFPRFNFAPESTASTLGDITSAFAVNPLRGGATSVLKLIPGIGSAVSKGGNAINKIPELLRAVGGNALVGGAYSPENTGLGMALGGAFPIAGKTINHLLGHTYPGIAKNIVSTTERQIAEHSSQYNNLWKQAEKEGYAHVKPNLKTLSDDFSFLEKGRAPAELQTLERFIIEPTMKNAQEAQIDMNRIARGIKGLSRRKTEDELKELATVTRAERELENSMFKNEKGEVNPDLRKKYNEITQSYKENVVPYRYHPGIKNYMENKSLPKELFSKINQGEFAAQKGIYHPEIERRNKLNAIANHLGIPLTGLGALFLGGSHLWNAVNNNKSHF